MSEKLKMPPFPELAYADPYQHGLLQFGTGWQGTLYLKTWEGFTEADPWSSELVRYSDGNIEMFVALEGDQKIPLPEQLAACQYLLDHEEAIQSVVMNALFKAYLARREESELMTDKSWESFDTMFEINHPYELKDWANLFHISVLPVDSQGTAYLLFIFDCWWDAFQAATITVHKERVIKIGKAGADDYYWSENT